MSSKEFAVSKNIYKGLLMINMCDKELLGSVLKEGELVVKISKEYFGNLLADEREAIDLLKECSIANLVGEKSIKSALMLGLASEDSIRVIDGVPFLMIFKFRGSYQSKE